MKLARLMESYINRSTVPSNQGPVNVNDRDVRMSPVTPMDRWCLEDKKRLRKVYVFDTDDQRNQYVFQLLQLESEMQHHADLQLTRKHVEVIVWTKDMGTVTDQDKRLAKMSDIIYKDVMCPIPETYAHVPLISVYEP